jgi:hypothetical protein
MLTFLLTETMWDSCSCYGTYYLPNFWPGGFLGPLTFEVVQVKYGTWPWVRRGFELTCNCNADSNLSLSFSLSLSLSLSPSYLYTETSILRNLNIMSRNLNDIVCSWIRLLFTNVIFLFIVLFDVFLFKISFSRPYFCFSLSLIS